MILFNYNYKYILKQKVRKENAALPGIELGPASQHLNAVRTKKQSFMLTLSK